MGQFKGNVQIVLGFEKNLDNEKVKVLKLEKAEKGKFNASSVEALSLRLKELSVKEGYPISRWSEWTAKDDNGREVNRKDCVPVLFANKWGQPNIGWVPPREASKKASTKVVFE